jgi:hypothetical protein
LPKDIREKILRAEKQRKLGNVAKSVMGKLVSKSITKVEHEGQKFTTQEDIERVLLPVNEAKFRASETTPFMQEPLLWDFSYQEACQAHEQVLQGTYQIPPTCDRAMAILIRGLAMSTVLINLAVYKPRWYISTEDNINGWKKQKKRTAGGMSGLHFGHYKAHLESPLLAAFDASLTSVAYTTGYSFCQWRKGLDVQLLEKLQCYLATNLRTILLTELDHNMNNKVLESDAMRAGSRIGAHAQDNYGGRKGLQASETAMNQILTVNSIWARRGRAVIMLNDAKDC